MSVPEINVCPGTLAPNHQTYSRLCLKRVFNGKKVSHILPYNAPRVSDEDAAKFLENRKLISISGVQEKLSLVLDKNKLRLTETGEKGTYILKPIPRDIKLVDQVPANEHLTMQIAKQVYGINTAENALIFFENGEPAYITKRFDVKDDGTNWGKEDFATLAGKTSENDGPEFKYNYNYEDLAQLIRKFVPAYKIEIERLYNLILFNYLFCNGDAHLKNFGLLETVNGDYILSPAYDLINTKLHVNDSHIALHGGLFADTHITKSFENLGYYAYDDFHEYGVRIGIPEKRVKKKLEGFKVSKKQVYELTQNSFLSQTSKVTYLKLYEERLNALNTTYIKA